LWEGILRRVMKRVEEGEEERTYEEDINAVNIHVKL